MEIELKYNIPDRETADRIWESDHFASVEDAGSREAVIMKGAYFDTEDQVLRSNYISFRVRTEGTGAMATLKQKNSGNEALHVRREINVPIRDNACLIQPSPAIFQESREGQELLKLVGERPLRCMLEIHFLRRKLRVDTGDCLCEVAIDVGEIITDAGCLPLCELEVELFTGDQKSLMEIGEGVAQRFGLKPESRSKYARGLAFLDSSKGEEKE
ncbi:MAG: CYTH domain-containing protein [Bacillota bacterium]|nr:CYTH domain-containing protein [Bacillota bacterium]